jgi:hypothetical protein
MAEIKLRYPHASVIDAERVVFNIGSNKYLGVPADVLIGDEDLAA